MARTRATRITAFVTVLTLVVCLGTQRPANASHSAWEHCSATFGPNFYAQQWTNHFYHGVFGWFYTYQPSVTNLNQDFSLSHLYPFTNGGVAFVEVGSYRGYGPEKIATNSSFYTASREDLGTYIEHDFADAPNATFVAYEAQYVGINFGNNKYIWSVYANNLTTPLWTWENKYLAMGIGQSGGETSARGNQVIGRMIPSHQLQLSGSWYNWTEAFMAQQGDFVRTCDEPNVAWTYNTKFDNYQFSGVIQ